MMDKIWLEEKYEDLLGRYQSERDTERKHYEVSYNSCTNNSSIIYVIQELIHGKDGDQRDLQKLLAEIRRGYENVKRTV